jgi:hypothetical protein
MGKILEYPDEARHERRKAVRRSQFEKRYFLFWE